jgi:hypothetical protein
MSKKIVDDALQQERVRYQKEKYILIRDLENRVNKVVQLELDLSEANDKYKKLENSMSEVILLQTLFPISK